QDLITGDRGSKRGADPVRQWAQRRIIVRRIGLLLLGTGLGLDRCPGVIVGALAKVGPRTRQERCEDCRAVGGYRLPGKAANGTDCGRSGGCTVVRGLPLMAGQ